MLRTCAYRSARAALGLVGETRPTGARVMVVSSLPWAPLSPGSRGVSGSAAARLARPAQPAAEPLSSVASSPPRRPLRVCVIGSGPAGMYTVDRLLKRFPGSAAALSLSSSEATGRGAGLFVGDHGAAGELAEGGGAGGRARKRQRHAVGVESGVASSLGSPLANESSSAASASASASPCPRPLEIDVLEGLPTPFGLVRSGVAPDHPETKNAENGFSQTIEGNRGVVRWLGNVRVGRDVSVEGLLEAYDAVVLAHGAEGDASLHVPNESARGVLPARRFVWWYNGHPEVWDESATSARAPSEKDVSSSEEASLDLSPRHDAVLDFSRVKSVAIFGIGNVALDCARILLKGAVGSADATDLAAPAGAALRAGGGVRDVHLVARRGPAQAACTAKELRECLKLPDVDVVVHDAERAFGPEGGWPAGGLKDLPRARARVAQLFEQARDGAFSPSGDAAGGQTALTNASSSNDASNDASASASASASSSSPPSALRRLHFHFLRRPVAFETADGSPEGMLTGVRLECTATVAPPRTGTAASRWRRSEDVRGWGTADGAVAKGASDARVGDCDATEGKAGNEAGNEGETRAHDDAAPSSSPPAARFEELPIELALVAVGYRGRKVPGVPLDPQTGRVPNVRGAVLASAPSDGHEHAERVIPGLFVVGWAKRGASGILGTNLTDAEETVAELLAQVGRKLRSEGDAEEEDHDYEEEEDDTEENSPENHSARDASRRLRGREALDAMLSGDLAALTPTASSSPTLPLLRHHRPDPVTWEQWLRIDAAEKKRGHETGKPREKTLTTRTLLDIAHGKKQ